MADYMKLNAVLREKAGKDLDALRKADMIPAVIYTIPPSSPLYHVRFAQIYGSTPDYVYVGYTPGYLGAYVYDGVVVFGTDSL